MVTTAGLAGSSGEEGSVESIHGRRDFTEPGGGCSELVFEHTSLWVKRLGAVDVRAEVVAFQQLSLA